MIPRRDQGVHQRMDQRACGKILVIGVGNPFRQDDGAGLAVARKLKGLAEGTFSVVEQGGEGATLLESWRDAGVVLLLDAVQSGAAPGTIHRLDAKSQALPANMFRASSHAFGLADAVELGRALGQLPEKVTVYGIEGKNFQAGTGLSPEVESAVPDVVQKVLEEIRSLIG
jgi:hydrogenase maturation protease